jgi:hypothetical protein
MKPLAQRWPWLLALAGGAGLTLLVVGGLALFGSPELLERAANLGDTRLACWLAGAFVVACGLCRLVLVRRRLPEERVDDVQRRAQRYLR